MGVVGIAGLAELLSEFSMRGWAMVNRVAMVVVVYTALFAAQAKAEKPSFSSSSSSSCQNLAWCLTGVTKAKLEAAKRVLKVWETREKTLPYFGQADLAKLPLTDTILKPRPNGAADPARRNDHVWGHDEILFTIRRAAYFTQLLFPELASITLLRVDTTHPPPPASSFDTHTAGRCADIAYILTGSGDEPDASIDIERTFWFAYAVRTSPYFAQMLTDFKDELLAYRTLAVETGLIDAQEFRDHDLMADRGMNHDTHLHVGVRS